MRPRDARRGHELLERLSAYESTVNTLPGISAPDSRHTFVEQMIESLRRNEFIAAIRTRDCSPSRCDPYSPIFDPVRAAIFHTISGQIDEAFWLTFLFVHFGKNLRTGYRLTQDVYGGLGKHIWSWSAICADLDNFRQWLDRNDSEIKARGGRFGNHRKYQSLSAWKANGTGEAIRTYIAWIVSNGGHLATFSDAYTRNHQDRHETFDDLYRAMSAVSSFGRTAKFDYLTMVGKLGLAEIEPPTPFMSGATGPLEGARLLFGRPRLTANSAEKLVVELGNKLEVGMQVMEDSLCNWQKNPSHFVAFRG